MRTFSASISLIYESQPCLKKGETVFYQVVVRDVKYNGSKQDVKGNIKSFVVE